jgi:hypothetical protein
MTRLRDLFRRRGPPAPTTPSPLPPQSPPAIAAPRPFRLPDPAAGDPLLALALMIGRGRRCLLTGDDAARLARACLSLRQQGAASALVASPDPPGDADAALQEEALRWGLMDVAPALLERPLAAVRGLGGTHYLDCDLPADWWVKAALDQGDLAHRAGAVDLLVDFRSLGANPDPLARLSELAATGARELLLEDGASEADHWLDRLGFRTHRRVGTILVARRR